MTKRTSLAGLMGMGAITLALAACGGGSPPAQTPEGAGGGGGTGSTAAAEVDAGPTTTTTATLGDAGDLQGTKLTSSSTVTMDGGSTTTAPRGPGTGKGGHDPGRSPQDIQGIIQVHRGDARACYDAGEKTHPGIEGFVDITWTIDPDGNVTATGVDASKSQIAEPGVIKCIGEVIKKIKFAASPRGVETHAHYPFNFHPHHHRK